MCFQEDGVVSSPPAACCSPSLLLLVAHNFVRLVVSCSEGGPRVSEGRQTVAARAWAAGLVVVCFAVSSADAPGHTGHDLPTAVFVDRFLLHRSQFHSGRQQQLHSPRCKYGESGHQLLSFNNAPFLYVWYPDTGASVLAYTSVFLTSVVASCCYACFLLLGGGSSAVGTGGVASSTPSDFPALPVNCLCGVARASCGSAGRGQRGPVGVFVLPRSHRMAWHRTKGAATDDGTRLAHARAEPHEHAQHAPGQSQAEPESQKE
nr:hypothetical protein Iba_chr04aCG14010 [Ipomoea batatas]